MSEAKMFHIGCQSWGYDDWVTKADGPTIVYPRGTKQADMLADYARLLETVEVDSTAYGVPPASTFEAWIETVGEDFSFSLKVPNAITHKFGLDERSLPGMAEFCERSRLLGERLGVILIQLPARFDSTKGNAQQLRDFLTTLPADLRFAVEFREAGWFVDWTVEELNTAGVALALVEGPWVDREIMFRMMPAIETGHAYVRLMGKRDLMSFDRIQRERDREIAMWAERLRDIAADEICVYADNHFEGHAPATVNKIKRLLGLPVHDPASLESQSSLF